MLSVKENAQLDQVKPKIKNRLPSDVITPRGLDLVSGELFCITQYFKVCTSTQSLVVVDGLAWSSDSENDSASSCKCWIILCI